MFVPHNPSAHVACLASGQMCCKCTISRMKQMMPLIKNKAWGKRIALVRKCGLYHHKGMVGDNKLGVFGLARGAFLKAFVIMITGRKNTFATFKRKPACIGKAKNMCGPPGIVAACEITFLCLHNPTRHKT